MKFYPETFSGIIRLVMLSLPLELLEEGVCMVSSEKEKNKSQVTVDMDSCRPRLITWILPYLKFP